jgi:hypothetical protein
MGRGGAPKGMKTVPLAYARGSVQFPAQNRDRQGAASSTERLELSFGIRGVKGALENR